MDEIKIYQNFPIRIVIFCNLLPILIYASGATILAGFSLWVSLTYLLFCLWLEYRVLKYSCVNCYYYGKICGSGKGKLCSLLFKPGDPQAFAQKEISWAELIPDSLISLIPLVGGIILLILDFSWLTVGLLILLLTLTFGGNAVIRGNFMCKHCRQRELGCPAEKLFRKEGA
jgi:hypothetical protein